MNKCNRSKARGYAKSLFGLSSMACGVAGDNLVIWGGAINSTTGNATLIYNIKEDQWTTTFTPPTPSTSSTAGASTPTGTTDTTQMSNKSPLGAPVGAGVAAVALVAAIGIFIYFRKKTARRQHQNEIKRPSPVAKESKYINMDSMSPPSDPPALEISKASAPHSPNIAFGKPQNLEHFNGHHQGRFTDTIQVHEVLKYCSLKYCGLKRALLEPSKMIH
ncbi:hypothetical protein BGZ46_001866 [Entomortierella lignicola]|nr:hypothetical protein BGZ46_001866 [Entomortierella lignicola]